MQSRLVHLFLILSLGISAQDLSKSDFKNSKWFSKVKGKDLFKHDTLVINKLLNIQPEKHSNMSSFLEMNFLNVKLISNLHFKRSNTYIDETDFEWCGFNFEDQVEWQFDNQRKCIQFYDNNFLIAEYMLVKKIIDSATWNNNSDTSPIELRGSILTLELKKVNNN